MASYLEEYGAAEQRHAHRLRLFKWAVGIVLASSFTGFILYLLFQNYAQERQIKTFVQHLSDKDYAGAYRMWGCTDATPCRDYSMKQFLDDWGPASPHADAATAQVRSGDSCGTGVVVPVDFKGAEQVPLWVERGSNTIGFSPDPECRKRHWRFREFFRSLFHKQSLLYLND